MKTRQLGKSLILMSIILSKIVMPGRIFLSHSAHTEADIKFRDRLFDCLEKEGFDVYCDRMRLEIGDSWRTELYSAISFCQAAVVLVTQDALKIEQYPWVFKECSMFTLLKHVDNRFPIIPIMMTNVTLDNIKKSPFKVLQLEEIMEGSYEDLELIINVIKTKLSDAEYSNKKDPLYYYLRLINRCCLSLNDDKLKKAIETIGELYPERDKRDKCSLLDKEIRYTFSRILLSLSAEKLFNVLDQEDLKDILVMMKKSSSYALIEMLAPFWFDFPSIALMDFIIQKEQDYIKDIETDLNKIKKTAFGLNALRELVATMFVRQYGLLKSKYYIIRPPDDGGYYDVEKTYIDHINAKINSRVGNSNSEDEIKQPVDRNTKDMIARDLNFIILPHGISKDVVQRLREEFNYCIFIVLIGGDDTKYWDLPQFKILEPNLEDEIHNKINKKLKEAYYHVNCAFNEILPGLDN